VRIRIVTRVEPGKATGVGQYWERLRSCLKGVGIGCDWLALKDWLGGQVAGNPATDLLIMDNQDSIVVQPQYHVIAVQHGCAGEHKARVPSWNCGDILERQATAAKRPNTFWVGCSQWAAAKCKQHTGVAADRIIYGCVDTERFIPSERQRLRDAKKPVVLHHCQDDNKGSGLIGAVAQELGDAFEVRRLKVPPDKVADAMREADIWLCLSASEGLPTVAQEALSCGLVAVSTNVGIFWPYMCGVPVTGGAWANTEIGSVIFDWRQRTNAPFVANMVRAAWACRGQLHGREYARQWWGVPIFTQKWLETIRAALRSISTTAAPVQSRAGGPVNAPAPKATQANVVPIAPAAMTNVRGRFPGQ